MPIYKRKAKIKEVEIEVKDFDKEQFIISSSNEHEEKHTVIVFSSNLNGPSLNGKSSPFVFDKNTKILIHCRQAYDRLIVNVEKYVEENEN